MEQQTAMQKLLAQLKHERQNLPISIEWDRCYQSIEMVIQNTYLQMEKEQMQNIIDAYVTGRLKDKNINYGIEYYNKLEDFIDEGEEYYNKTYNNETI